MKASMLRREVRPLPHKQMIEGRRFGKWTVIRYAGMRKCMRYFWCQCKCGKKSLIPYSNLCTKASPQCKTCGAKQAMEKIFGEQRKALKNCRYAYRSLCSSKARGELCEEWQKDLIATAQRIGERPGRGYELTRIVRDKPLGPDNWKWAKGEYPDMLRTINGETRPTKEWCKILGVTRERVRQLALREAGKCLQCKGLSETVFCRICRPANRQLVWSKNHEHNGKALTIHGWAKEWNVSYATAYKRIKSGFTLRPVGRPPQRIIPIPVLSGVRQYAF